MQRLSTSEKSIQSPCRNCWVVSACMHSLLEAYALWRGRRQDLPGCQPGKLEGPDQGVWHNLGFIFMFSLVALFRMARFIVSPNQDSYMSAAFISILQASSQLEQKILNATDYYCNFYYQLIEDFFTSVLPLGTVYLILFLWAQGWSLLLQYLYYFKYIFIFLSYGERSVWQVFKDPTRDKHREAHKDDNYWEHCRQAQWFKDRCKRMDNFSIHFRDQYDDSITTANKKITKIWDVSRAFCSKGATLRQSLFDLYATALFSGVVSITLLDW